MSELGEYFGLANLRDQLGQGHAERDQESG